MGNGSGVSRGDRNRNARLERLRVNPSRVQRVDLVVDGVELSG
jgi:hypothetical protein